MTSERAGSLYRLAMFDLERARHLVFEYQTSRVSE